MNGWIVIDKPLNCTSNQVNVYIKNTLGVKSGYLGTLDPMATGVLPIAINNTTKDIVKYENKDKGYLFDIEFGIQTNTGDKEGEVVKTTAYKPTLNEVESVLSHFTGYIMQKPHRYSAIKINGKRAYDIARSGIMLDIPKRQIQIFNLDIISYKDNTMRLYVKCSKGTYVRTLCEDIAEKVNSYGHVAFLRRTHSGPFGIENSINNVFNLTKEELSNSIITNI